MGRLGPARGCSCAPSTTSLGQRRLPPVLEVPSPWLGEQLGVPHAAAPEVLGTAPSCKRCQGGRAGTSLALPDMVLRTLHPHASIVSEIGVSKRLQ